MKEGLDYIKITNYLVCSLWSKGMSLIIKNR